MGLVNSRLGAVKGNDKPLLDEHVQQVASEVKEMGLMVISLDTFADSAKPKTRIKARGYEGSKRASVVREQLG